MTAATTLASNSDDPIARDLILRVANHAHRCGQSHGMNPVYARSKVGMDAFAGISPPDTQIPSDPPILCWHYDDFRGAFRLFSALGLRSGVECWRIAYDDRQATPLPWSLRPTLALVA